MIQIDMEMPDNCYCCILCRHADMFCRRLGKFLDRDDCYDERDRNCPLHEVTADSDTISRKQAIDAMAKFVPYAIDDDVTRAYTYGLTDAYNLVCQLPSAQPEERTEERTETHGVCLDTISRKAAIDALDKIFPADPMRNDYTQGITCGAALATEYIKQLPSAHPEIIRCKDCKHWKDSDGVYRRGIGAESKCPVNIRAVYEGNFYCADAERRTDG